MVNECIVQFSCWLLLVRYIVYYGLEYMIYKPFIIAMVIGYSVVQEKGYYSQHFIGFCSQPNSFIGRVCCYQGNKVSYDVTLIIIKIIFGQIFMDYFSSALCYEYSDKGIIVQVGSCELLYVIVMILHCRVYCHFSLQLNCQESGELLSLHPALKSMCVMPWQPLECRIKHMEPQHMLYK